MPVCHDSESHKFKNLAGADPEPRGGFGSGAGDAPHGRPARGGAQGWGLKWVMIRVSTKV